MGDVVVMKPGDGIPADGLLFAGEGVKSNESGLTGEPDDLTKRAEADCFLYSRWAGIFFFFCDAVCVERGSFTHYAPVGAISGRTSRGHTAARRHRSFCFLHLLSAGALILYREEGSAKPVQHMYMYLNILVYISVVRNFIFSFPLRKPWGEGSIFLSVDRRILLFMVLKR